MAGGTLSPRQKMINLMYLVFIAMIAMTMSKEVLSAFGLMNERFVYYSETVESRNEQRYEALALKAADQPEKYAEENQKAIELKRVSQEFVTYLEGVRADFLADSEDKEDYETMDKEDTVNAYFFAGEGYTPAGREFLDRIEAYKNKVVEIDNSENNAQLAETHTARFDTSDKDVEGGNEPWLRNRYEGFPLISSVTNITAMITDVRITESELVQTMTAGQLESDVALKNYQAMVIPEKSAFYQGENFKGRVVLGRVDASMVPQEISINGQKVSEGNIVDGGANLDFPAGAIGDREIKGEFVFIENGAPKSIPIVGTYAVIPRPNSAVISADKMNVVYRGVDNPMTISIPGLPQNKVVASAPGLKRVGSGSSYIMNPGAGKEVKISVTGTLDNGEKVSSSQTFRIKGIPSPSGTVRNEAGYVKMPKTSLEKVTVGVALLDFDFDLTLNTTGFTIKVPGESAVVVRGNKMNDQAKRAISKAKRGDVVTIFDIKSSLVGNSSYRMKNAAAVSIEIQ